MKNSLKNSAKNVDIMGRMTARDIAKNFLQYLSMVVINMLAVTLFCGFVSNALTLDRTLKKYYEDSNLTDIICQFSALTENDRTFFETLDTDALEYRLYSEGSAGKNSAKIYVCATDNKISLPVIAEGERGVLVDKHVSERDGLSIGSELDVEMPLPLGTTRLVVTGIMTFTEAAATHTYSPLYIDFDALFETLFPLLPENARQNLYKNYCNQILIKTPSPQNVKDVINAYYAQAEEHGLVFVSSRDSMESVVMLNGEISQSVKMTCVFPVIFMLVSALVVLSTISPLILRERTNIGTLKSIGIKNSAILLHYSLFGAVLCLIGGVIGVIIGPLIIPNVLLVKYNLIYSIPHFVGIVYSPVWSAVALLAVCASAALIGLLVCFKAVREKPAACMRPPPPKEKFIIAKIYGRSRKGKPRGISQKMAVRNIIVKPARAVMTVIGVTGCLALLVCSFGIGDTVNNSIDFELGVQFKYDVSAAFAKESEAEADFLTLAEELKNEKKIDAYESYKVFYMSAKAENIKDIKIFALADNSMFTTINPGGKTLISRSVADDLKAEIGEIVTLSAAGRQYSLTIDGIIETAFTKGIFLTDTDGLFDGSFYTLGIWLKTDNADEELLGRLNSLGGNANTMAKIREDVDKTISSITAIRLTMMVFSITLAVTVLYNLSLLNIKERTRDIATMKVLGFSTGEIARSLLYEIMILVTLCTVCGLFFGYPITILVMTINKIEALTFIYHIKSISYLISAIISLVTAFGINFLFLRSIKKINMTESLKSIE